ncbi:hypothetical protein TNCV_1565731 [Trichonephila clavipes]|nr:hypothetical protein TNCV_1565731 [Trichonephila clavipes]
MRKEFASQRKIDRIFDRCQQRQISGPVFLSTTCTVYGYAFEQCKAEQLFRMRPKVPGKPKITDIWGTSVV